MSLAELLPAIRALSVEEKLLLMHSLNDEVNAASRPADDGITAEMRKLLPPPGSVIDFVWPTTVDADSHAIMDKVLIALKEGRSPADIEQGKT